MSAIYTWLPLIGLLLVVGGVFGYWLAEWGQTDRRRDLDARASKLDADWQSLRTAQQLHVAFTEARKAMWEEAVRQPRPSRNGYQYPGAHQ